jgi:uncharacterized protein (TIGR02147 family)
MEPTSHSEDYRLILKEELETRCAQNNRYSLRAFARDLNISPSRLCEVLKGKQGLSRKVALDMADTLGYHGSEKDRFCDLVESVHARSKKDRDAASERLKKYEVDSDVLRLKNDTFKTISDWHHLAILEMIPLPFFENNPKWIARKLGISEVEVQLAVDRLIRLGLIKMEDGTLSILEGVGFITGDVPSDSIKKFHSQILKRAEKALYLQSIDKREYGTYMLSIDKSKINEAKQAIREFQHKFCKDMDEVETKDSLYCLSFQFFDVLDGGKP